jgi:hypothetical protein
MACNHEQLRCTDNVFYCPLCGASWASPPEDEQKPADAATPSEAPKRAAKRTTRKTDE